MVAQIPLPWLLTDVLCAMGLGFLYGFVGWLAGLLPQRRLRGRRARQLQRMLRYTSQAAAAVAAVFFTQAWVLTGSHSAQVRWFIVLGVAVGFAAFWLGVARVLDSWLAAGCRVVGAVLDPPLKLAKKCRRRLHLWALPRRERHRVAYEKRARHRAERRKKIKESKKTKNNSENMQENFQKELQSPRVVYYNNL